jgi:aspartate racemase
LATIGTVHVRLYQNAFRDVGMLLEVPTPAEQKIVDAAIDAVKAGQIENNPWLAQLDEIVRNHAAEAALAGCTEIPLVFPHLKASFTRLDATAILAEMAVQQALTPALEKELVRN